MVDWININGEERNEIINNIVSILNEAELEKDDSFWSVEQIELVKKEFAELKKWAERGKILLKYGKKHFMLESTYMITDSIKPLTNTKLGIKILLFQELLRKI